MAVAIISVAVAAHQAWSTNVFTLATDLFPAHQVSTVVGIDGKADHWVALPSPCWSDGS